MADSTPSRGTLKLGVNWRRAGLPLKLGAEGDDSWIVGLWLCLYLPPDTGARPGTLFRDTGTLCANVRGTLERPLVDTEGESEAAVAAVKSQTTTLAVVYD